MIKRKVVYNDRQYIVGFREYDTGFDCNIYCYILKKKLIWYQKIFERHYLKGPFRNYYDIAKDTIKEFELLNNNSLNKTWPKNEIKYML